MTMTAVRRRKAVVGGLKVTNNIESFSQPTFTKTYADIPGSFVGAKQHIGFEASEWKLVLHGEAATTMMAAMLLGENSVLIYTESGVRGTEKYESIHTMTGDISREYSESKNGSQQTLTLTGQIKNYAWVESGVPITTISIPNDEYFIDGVAY